MRLVSTARWAEGGGFSSRLLLILRFWMRRTRSLSLACRLVSLLLFFISLHVFLSFSYPSSYFFSFLPFIPFLAIPFLPFLPLYFPTSHYLSPLPIFLPSFSLSFSFLLFPLHPIHPHSLSTSLPLPLFSSFPFTRILNAHISIDMKRYNCVERILIVHKINRLGGD